jgi:hypothetical protein
LALDASEEGYTPYYEPATYDVFVDNANLNDLLAEESSNYDKNSLTTWLTMGKIFTFRWV